MNSPNHTYPECHRLEHFYHVERIDVAPEHCGTKNVIFIVKKKIKFQTFDKLETLDMVPKN